MNQENFRTPLARFKQKHVGENSLNSPSSYNLPASPLLEKLGCGTGVEVYLYERPPKNTFIRSPWAVKKVSKRTNCNSALYEKRLKQESNILKRIKHENIISFRALMKSPSGKGTCLAMEFGEESLFDLIELRMEAQQGSFVAGNILKVARDMSSALTYLHNEKHILHGDIKSGNILVINNFETVKLCDFGVTVTLDENLKALSQYVGTVAWSAMEVHIGGEVTDKADIFSLGLVFYEMLTLNIPYGHIFPEEEDYDDAEKFEQDNIKADEQYQELLGTQPTLPNIQFDKSYGNCIELMLICTHEDAKKRPSASKIYEALQQDELLCPAKKLVF